jgi:drug/metabolite transporter (DMT)-like permease
MTRTSAFFSLLAVALLWSTGGVLIKSVDWTPLGIAGSRAAIAFFVIWAIRGNRPIRFSWPLVGGTVCYAATITLFVVSNRLTTAANAIFLQYTAPIYIALFGSKYVGEETTAWDWFTIAVAFVGMSLFFFDQLTVANVWGNIVALSSGISFAWLALFLRRQKEGSPIDSIFLGNLIAALMLAPFVRGPLPSTKGWAILFFLGLFQLGFPYYLYSKAIAHVSALEAIMVPFIEPILNPIWVLLLMKERPGPMALIGGGIILLTVMARGLKSQKLIGSVVLVLIVFGCTRNRVDPFGAYTQNVDTLAEGIQNADVLKVYDDQIYVFSTQNEGGKSDLLKWTRKGTIEPILTGIEDLGSFGLDPRRGQIYISAGNSVSIRKFKEPDKVIAKIDVPGSFDDLSYSLMNRKAYAIREEGNEIWEIDPVRKTAKRLGDVQAKLRYLRPSVDGTKLHLVTKEPARVLDYSLRNLTVVQVGELPSGFDPVGIGFYRFHFIFMDHEGHFAALHSKKGNASRVIVRKDIEVHPKSFALDMFYALSLEDKLIRFPISVEEK